MKRIAVFVLSMLLLASMVSVCSADVELDLSKALESGTATRTVITPTVDGEAVKVTWYVAP